MSQVFHTAFTASRFIWGTVLLAAFLGAQQPDPKVAALIEQAQAALDQEDYQSVVQGLEQAVSLHPELPGAYYQLGLAYFHLGNHEKAKQRFEQELTYGDPDAFSLYYLGRIALVRGEIEKAILNFEKAHGVGKVLDIERRLAGAYLSAGLPQKAVPILEDSLRTRPEQGELHYQLGRAYRALGRTEDAEREFQLSNTWKNKEQELIRSVLRLDVLLTDRKVMDAISLAGELRKSEDPEVLLAAGMALGRHGLRGEALPLLRRVVELQPKNAEAHYNLAVTLTGRQQLREAARHLQRAIEIRPTFYEAQMMLGTMLVQTGQSEQAIPHLQAAVDLNDRNPKLVAMLGLQYLQGNYYQEAIPALKRAVELDPENSSVRFLLIQAHYRNHDFEEALRQARATLQRFPELARSHFQVGSQLDNMGRFVESAQHLREALKIDPSLFEARLMLAEGLIKQGQPEASIAEYRKVISQDPSIPHAYAGLGKALIQLKRYEEAAREMEAAIQVDSELAPLHLYLSQAYRALGRQEDAKREAAAFALLNKIRAQKRDRDVERKYKQ